MDKNRTTTTRIWPLHYFTQTLLVPPLTHTPLCPNRRKDWHNWGGTTLVLRHTDPNRGHLYISRVRTHYKGVSFELKTVKRLVPSTGVSDGIWLFPSYTSWNNGSAAYLHRLARSVCSGRYTSYTYCYGAPRRGRWHDTDRSCCGVTSGDTDIINGP